MVTVWVHDVAQAAVCAAGGVEAVVAVVATATMACLDVDTENHAAEEAVTVPEHLLRSSREARYPVGMHQSRVAAAG